MKLLVYLGHPAHFHLFRQVIVDFREAGHGVTILARKKDVLEDLLNAVGFPYENVLPKGRSNTRIGMLRAMATREWAIFRAALKERPTLMVGTCAEIGHCGRLLGIPAVVVNEDDFDVVPLFSKLAYPFCRHILSPDCCRAGKWRRKTIAYKGYHELAYLHPNRFTPDRRVVREFHQEDRPFFLMRFAKLTAHHDEGRTGLAGDVVRRLLEMLQTKGEVYITSERDLEPEFEKHRIRLDPVKIHHALAFADLYVGDSQTMAAEAAVLGTPAIRFNDFVGEIGYLEELEHVYGLTYGVRTNEPERLLKLVDRYSKNGSKALWAERRRRMLKEKIDVGAFLTWFFKNYPESARRLANEPSYPERFPGLRETVPGNG